MNRQLSKLWLAALLAVGVFASCNKGDRSEPNSPAEVQGETVTLSLSAELGFEEEVVHKDDLKSIDFMTISKNSKLIPVPQFADGTLLDVHTIIKSSNGYTNAKTLKWKYIKSSHKLVLRLGDEGNSFNVWNFNNSGGVKWYIGALLAPGTSLDEFNKTVTISGTRELKCEIRAHEAPAGTLNVPYWTGWMELTLHTSDGSGNYLHGDAKEATNKFRPLGSLIRVYAGNALAGGYDFTCTGFAITSNAFCDKGTFNFNNSTIPATNPQDANPVWEEKPSPMSYKFIPGNYYPHNSVTINNGNLSLIPYLIWVMPYDTPPATAQTRVMLKGTSSRPETATYRDYTKTYFTDYHPRTTGTQGKPQHGKIHELKAKATRRVALPIEYVTEYNLAGGGLLQSMSINGTPNQQPEGIKGPLRFSNFLSNGSPNPNPHRNDQSGYYNWYELMGIQHGTYNPGPTPRNLQGSDVMVIDTDGVFRKLADKYFIPDGEHLWGISLISRNWSDLSVSPNQWDYLHLHDGLQEYYLSASNFSGSFTDPLSGTDAANNAVIYAIRFRAYPPYSITQRSYNPFTSSVVSSTFLGLPVNSLRCAYRFTRIGGKNRWDISNNSVMDTQLRIDVVHLGETDISEDGKTELEVISDQSWWDAPSSSRTTKGLGPVISRTFPTGGYTPLPSYLDCRGKWGMYWSRTAVNGSLSAYMSCTSGVLYSNLHQSWYSGLSVRLFKRDPDQP